MRATEDIELRHNECNEKIDFLRTFINNNVEGMRSSEASSTSD